MQTNFDCFYVLIQNHVYPNVGAQQIQQSEITTGGEDSESLSSFRHTYS
jgi:hypothetical protein